MVSRPPGATIGTGPAFLDLMGITVDESPALVLDSSLRAVTAVDFLLGQRATVSR
jgi:hypothetical protein